MHAARKELSAVLSQVDVVIEALDARLPFSSQNPMLTELCGDKLCVKAMLKADLSAPHAVAAWQDYFRGGDAATVPAVSTLKPQSIRALTAHCRRLVAVGGRRRTRVTMMVAGIPNVGKSALINALAGRAIAKTGNQPALTRRQQSIALGADWLLLDTPGVLWPNIKNRNSGFRLAASGAIRDTAMSHTEVAAFLAQYLLAAYPRHIAARFGFKDLPDDPHAVLHAIGKQRGCLKSGGQIDMERTAKLFVHEFRSGALGKICLETPAMMQQELAELEIIERQKVTAQQARRARRTAKKSRAVAATTITTPLPPPLRRRGA